MMRRNLMLCGFISLVLLFSSILPATSPTINAQTADPEWRYAYNRDGQLAAYTLDGDVNILIDEEFDNLGILASFDDSNALILVERDRTYSLYHVSPSSADVVLSDLVYPVVPLARTDRYMLLGAVSGTHNLYPIRLYDAEKHQVHDLQGLYNNVVQRTCCGFSEDGQTLRYFSYLDEDAQAWAIIERDLATGEEHVFFAPNREAGIDPNPIYLKTNQHGDRWFWSDYDRETDSVTINIVSDGEDGAVLDTYQGDPHMQFVFVGGSFMGWPPLCEDSCEMTVQSIAGDSLTVQTNGAIPSDLIQLNETQFLMETAEAEFWRISTDHPPEYVGELSSTMMALAGIEPRNGRWLTLIDNYRDPPALIIWDLDTQDRVFEYPLPDPEHFFLSDISYSPVGQILDTSRQHIGFEYATGTVVQFPDGPREFRQYFEMLPDGTTLVNRYYTGLALSAGIWRYDPSSETFAPVFAEPNWWALYPTRP